MNYRMLKNVIASYGGQIAALLYGILMTPLMIHAMGDAQYGVWTVASSLLAYFALFDLGFANALVKYTAEYSARNDQSTINRMTSTLFTIFSFFGLLIFVLSIWLSMHFSQFFSVPAEYIVASRWTVLILGLNFALGLPLSVFNALIVGYQRYDLLNIITAIFLLLQGGGIYCALKMNSGLVGVAVAFTIFTVLKPLALGLCIRFWTAPGFSIQPGVLDRRLAATLLNFSIFMFIIFACRQIETSTSNVIVGRYISVAGVTYYTVGSKLSGLVKSLISPVTLIFFPAFSELSSSADRSRLRQLYTQGMKISLMIGAPVTGFAIVLTPMLIRWWIGPEFVSSSAVAMVLLLQSLLIQIQTIAGSLLGGVYRLKVWTGLHIFVVAFNLVFSLIFVDRWGAMAVALASLLAWAIAMLAGLPYACRVIELPAAEFLRQAFLPPLGLGVVCSLALYGMVYLTHSTSLFPGMLMAALCALLYGLLYWLFAANWEERRSAITAIERISHKKLSSSLEHLLLGKNSVQEKRDGADNSD